MSYPFLIPDSQGVDYFPTVFAHLLGQPITWTDISTSLACLTLTNPGADPIQAQIRVDLSGYSDPSLQMVAVNGKSTSTFCVNPTPDLSALYSLTAPVPGQIHTTVTPLADGAIPVLDDVHPVTITDGTTVFNRRNNEGQDVHLYKYQAVVATPKDSAVQALLTPIAKRSAWGTFGVGGYGMHLDADKKPIPRNPVTLSVDAGASQAEGVYFAAGESIVLQIDNVSCDCVSKSVDVYVLNEWDYRNTQTTGMADLDNALVRAPESVAHDTITVSAPTDGKFYLVFRNGSATGPNTVTYHRTGTTADTVIDAIQAVYEELRAWQVSYVSISTSFFDAPSTQSVRWPKTALSDHAANCLDGSLLFASLIEALQLEPVIFIVLPGHAFVGVRQSPGGAVVWPVETTMLGGSPFPDAFDRGLEEYRDPSIQHLADIDIKVARAAGLTPIPE